ncbi:uncharacterized protein [Misgurnus anguillicaudatus]|uniref:uncharacterized protein n=1 Tax=Misgurnus anguillicaudatus TaxID=75329 RepID=UPI003CCFBAF6
MLCASDPEWWRSISTQTLSGRAPFPPQRELPLMDYALAVERSRGCYTEFLASAYLVAGLNDPPPLHERQSLLQLPYWDLVDHLAQQQQQQDHSGTPPPRSLSSPLPPIPEGLIIGMATQEGLALSAPILGSSAQPDGLRGKHERRISWESPSEGSSTEPVMPTTPPPSITLSAPRPKKKKRKKGSSALQPAAASPASDSLQPQPSASAQPPLQPLPSAQPPLQPLPSAQPPLQPLPSALPPLQPLPSAQPPLQPLPSAQPPLQPLPSAQPPLQPLPSAQPPLQPLPSAQPPLQPPVMVLVSSPQPPAAPPVMVPVSSPQPSAVPPVFLPVPGSQPAPMPAFFVHWKSVVTSPQFVSPGAVPHPSPPKPARTSSTPRRPKALTPLGPTKPGQPPMNSFGPPPPLPCLLFLLCHPNPLVMLYCLPLILFVMFSWFMSVYQSVMSRV